MAQFVTCELCGANLDFNEKCDCQKEKEATPLKRSQPQKVISSMFSLTHKASKVKSSRRCSV